MQVDFIKSNKKLRFLYKKGLRPLKSSRFTSPILKSPRFTSPTLKSPRFTSLNRPEILPKLKIISNIYCFKNTFVGYNRDITETYIAKAGGDPSIRQHIKTRFQKLLRRGAIAETDEVESWAEVE